MAYFQNNVKKKGKGWFKKNNHIQNRCQEHFFHAENDKCVKQAVRHSCSGKKHRGRMRKMRCLPQGSGVLRMDELAQAE